MIYAKNDMKKLLIRCMHYRINLECKKKYALYIQKYIQFIKITLFVLYLRYIDT
jgi:hypothetical protein